MPNPEGSVLTINFKLRGEEFLALAPTIPVRTEVTAYPLSAANEALSDLRDGRLQGAAVLIPEHT